MGCERNRRVLADGFRTNSAARGVGLIVKTARRSHAPNTWRGQLDWCRAGRPTRSVKDEQELRKAECGENVTARGHDKALRKKPRRGSILTQSSH